MRQNNRLLQPIVLSQTLFFMYKQAQQAGERLSGPDFVKHARVHLTHCATPMEPASPKSCDLLQTAVFTHQCLFAYLAFAAFDKDCFQQAGAHGTVDNI